MKPVEGRCHKIATITDIAADCWSYTDYKDAINLSLLNKYAEQNKNRCHMAHTQRDSNIDRLDRDIDFSIASGNIMDFFSNN